MEIGYREGVKISTPPIISSIRENARIKNYPEIPVPYYRQNGDPLRIPDFYKVFFKLKTFEILQMQGGGFGSLLGTSPVYLKCEGEWVWERFHVS